MRIPLAPIACSLVSLIAGYVAFHPAWRKVAPLSDGSVASFQQASEAVANGNLLAKASPQERVGWLLEICRQPDGAARDFALYEAIQKMQPSDFIAAFAQLEELGAKMYAMSQETREALATAGMERWLAIDPAGAHRVLSATLAVINSHAVKIPDLPDRELMPMYRVIAQRDPEWTKEMIGKLTNKTGRSSAIYALFSENVPHNAKQAREWLAAFAGTPDEEIAKSGYAYGLMSVDPQAGLAAILAEKDEGARARSLAQSFAKLAKSNPAAIPGLLPSLDPKKRIELMEQTASEVIADPSVEPFDFVNQFLQGASEQDTSKIISNSVDSLARRDPVKTMDWVNNLPENRREGAAESALSSWKDSDPGGLLDWLRAQPPEKLPTEYPLRGLAQTDPVKFGEWAKSLPQGAFRDRAMIDLADAALDNGDLTAVMAAYPQDLTSDSDAVGARFVAFQMARQDLQATVDWVSAMPAGLGQSKAAVGLVNAWAKKSPDAVATWLQTLPVGKTRDEATAEFSRNIVTADPAAAGEWIEQIGDPDTRAHAAIILTDWWQRRDSAQANAWMANLTGVPDSFKAYWLHHNQ